MPIKQFRYASDNLSYLVYDHSSALAVDAGAVDDILVFVSSKKLHLKYVLHTHEHPDHTSGTRELCDRSGARFLDQGQLLKDKMVSLDSLSIQVFHTPGHTLDSVCFFLSGYLVTGDTLFNGTVGNCFSGDLRAFYQSIVFLQTFPPETVIYAGHDYVEYAMAFARLVEPDNPDIQPYLNSYNPEHVFSRLKDEQKVNPYLRFNTPEMIAILTSKGLPVKTEYNRWESVMQLG
jgi:hydroxyacylglutathione hydrolase